MSNKPRLVEINTFFDEMPESNIEHETKGGRLATLLVGAVAFLAIVLIVPTIIVLPMAFAIDAVMQEARGAWHAVPATVPEVPSTLPGFTYVYDSAGNVVAQFYAENRQPVTFDEVSPLLVDAIVSVEDRRFWDHNGVDGNSVVRAAYANYIAGGAVQGASTLTQQLVENLKLLSAGSAEERDLARAQTLGGKVVEAKTALAMEAQMSKNEILEAYMNVVYFGAGSYGVAAAADRFFGVDVADLSVAQAATIAGMVREPSGLDPFRFPERAQSRRDTVLLAMRETGAITLWEYVTATNSPLDTSGGNQQPNGCTTSAYPFYCSIVREQLLVDGRLGRTQPQRDNAIAQGHLAVYTALDPAVMASIDASIAAAFDDSNRVATSVAVVEPGTGLVKGFGQNRQWGDGEGETEIPYVLSGFQPGSAFKAVIMAAALENGFNAHTAMSTRS
ncbi:MAG TPA: transglycosylase domain-containing protein, partial [Demequina sp.]|nr:transglycosylase domain-containing protein [Demequina sp.]